MIFTKKKILSKAEKKRLGQEFLVLTIFKPFGTGAFIAFIFLLFLPFDPFIPNVHEYAPVNSVSDYFDNIIISLKLLPKLFLAVSVLAFIYYLSREFLLIIDLARDYFSLEKTLGNYLITDKKVVLNNYYLKTNDPNFKKLKTNREIFNKIDKNQKINLVVSKAKRVYRFNPLIENFRIDKLL
tara:strand:- start:91 stop:639 length:549 start_codon:yes stop_codon:yes gene_type:complete